MSEKISQTTQESLLRRFLKERGPGAGVEITEQIEVQSADLLGSSDPGEQLSQLRKKDPERALLVAQNLLSEDAPEDSERAGRLKQEVLKTFEEVARTASDHEIPVIMDFTSKTLSGRMAAGYLGLGIKREEAKATLERMVEANENRLKVEDSWSLGKIKNDELA